MQLNKTLSGILFLLIFFLSCGKEAGKIDDGQPGDPLTKRKIILLIGDGMGLGQITAATVANGQLLNMERCKYIGLQKAFAADKLLTSSAAAITAMACGVKTNYEYIGVDTDGKKIPNIIEILEAIDYSTGIVSTAFLSDATPGGFYAHQPDRYDREAIAKDILGSDLDVFIGGGRDQFNLREDGLNLLDSLAARNYQVYDNLDAAMDVQAGKVACFTDEFRPPKISEGRGNMLCDATELALRLLDSNDKGFFLMVEGGQIDWACHYNDQEWMLDEMLDFDKTVGMVLNYAESDGNTLVIITSDHETAGYAIVGGDETAGTVVGEFISDLHTATMVPVFAHGPGAAEFAGVYPNTAFFDKFMDFYNLPN